jgi:hypothetical protein
VVRHWAENADSVVATSHVLPALLHVSLCIVMVGANERARGLYSVLLDNSHADVACADVHVLLTSRHYEVTYADAGYWQATYEQGAVPFLEMDYFSI